MQSSPSNHSRPYQGYPYVNPAVIDAPSLDAKTASRWTNLPRRQISSQTKREDHQVVYINVPEDRPGTSAVVEEAETQTNANAAEPRLSLPQKKENIDDTPVVYIDLPETSDSGLVQNAEEESTEPEFVQETIFYDPFEDRRIDRSKTEDSDSASDISSVPSIRGATSSRPLRPNTLHFNAPGSSGFSGGQSSTSSIASSTPVTSIPPMMSKETLIYGRTPAEEFSLSPLPEAAFPEPPPAYTEIDSMSIPQPVVQQPMPQTDEENQPPRTQVIIANQGNNSNGTPQAEHQIPIGLPNADRKYLNCHHCGMRVHTLVVREVGPVTHLIALMCLIICMLPIVFLIYTTSCVKNKNHYCPNCNKLIGYELPLNGKKVVYVN